ncbi:MAG: ferrochelatase [Alphaproteobacteria bacterium]|nr:ferrochelatase [Alphaproteobacteria bacterium]
MSDDRAPNSQANRGRPAGRERVAVVLFNLGGPDSEAAIRPFLLNLFRDPAIIRVPFLVRPILARVITRARLRPAIANYTLLGGRSPLLDLTRRQADALAGALSEYDARCFVAMRYWHPFSEETVQAVRAFAPDRVLLLPLYPQFSTTTTASSLTAWREAAARLGLAVSTTVLCCWREDASYAASIAALLDRAYREARSALPSDVPLRILFSAHGLPVRIVAAGDPYQFQVERTVAAVLAAWGEKPDWRISYQSRATPEEWLSPSTEAEIERAAAERVALLVMPIAFVSEHSETLVELDVEYRGLAGRLGVSGYFRVPTPGDDPGFIAALAGLARRALRAGPGLCNAGGGADCPARWRGCPFVARRVPADR